MKLSWRETAEMIGVASIVGSLIFVGLEMNQAQEIALNEWGYSTVESQIERNNTINGHPDIWARGNIGEDLSTAENVIYRNQIQTAWTIAFWSTRSQRRFGSTDDVAIADFSAFLYLNPGARKMWKEITDETRKYRAILIDSTSSQGVSVVVTANLEYLDSHEFE